MTPKFNETATNPTLTRNLAGGTAYAQNTRNELASLVLTSFLSDKFYRTGKEELARLRVLTQDDPLFAAQAAVYARNVHGMRSVSHVIAGEVVQHVKGEGWVKDFIRAVVRRPDDMTEIVAYRAATYGLHPLPNSLKKGLSLAFGKFDGYSLGKYRAQDKAIKLVDLVNLVRPRPTDRNRDALAALVAGTLRQEDTWEDRLSSGEDKAAVWRGLLTEKKLGYFALLRNIRNIAQQADDDTYSEAIVQLCDAENVQNSLVLPFRFLTAYKEMSKPGVTTYERASLAVQAISMAASHSVSNIPDLPGRTLVSLDMSGSMMQGRVGGDRSDVTAAEIGSLFAAALMRRLSGRAGLILFDTGVQHAQVNAADSVLTVAGQIHAAMHGGGTNMDLAFQTDQAYDRIIVLSDMQAWTNGQWRASGYGSYGMRFTGFDYYGRPVEEQPHKAAVGSLNEYKKRTGADPRVYSFDLTGYGSIQFPAERCYQLAGWSDKAFALLGLLDEDRDAMVNTIQEVVF